MDYFLVFLFSFLATGVVFLGVKHISALDRKFFIATAVILSGLYATVYFLALPYWGSDLLVLTGAVGIGALLSLFLGKKPNIVAFAVTAAVVDVVSFSGGLTAKISADFAAGSSDLLYNLAIFFPRGDDIRPLIGIGDLVIMGTFNAALLGQNNKSLLAFGIPLLGLFLALIVGLLAGGIFGIPFISGAVVLFLLKPELFKR